MTLWSHRFAAETAGALRRHGDSFPFDRRLLPQEIRASIAHANALHRAGILDAAERDAIAAGLAAILEAAADGVAPEGDHEDVHSFVEAELLRRTGPVAGKIHTGRSRNDQVATLYRLWLRDRIDGDMAGIAELLRAFVARARENAPVLLPFYTHLQRAQPTTLGHHLAAHGFALLRDRDRFREARVRVNVLPLGSAAGAGAGFPLDRAAVAAELGFAGVSGNSLDAVSDRDFLLDYLSAGAILAMHLSRFAEEVVLWTTPEFGFARLSDRASTGSSIMPQKRNPDGAELVRARAGRLAGHLAGALAVLKGLPLAYNKDLQELGPLILEAADLVRSSIELSLLLVREIEFRPERMAAALEGGFAEATELADFLVRKGVPFREAHGITARLVTEAERRGLTNLAALPDEALAAADPRLTPDVRAALTPEAAVRARRVTGGAAPEQVEAALRHLESAL